MRITSPENLYSFGNEIVPLQMEASDVETPNSLLYQWSIDLIHNNHRHPQVFEANGQNAQLALNTLVSPLERNSLEIYATVKDGGNVTGTAMVRAYPSGITNS